ncbi:hypothetical protein F4808DRAFT_355826 [Astrocystis sublimbata]|nr:hypothetical protein F4808DRAFT_355826 [Astrocystis sublimbata]
MTFREKYSGWRLGGLILSILSFVITVGLLVTLVVFSARSGGDSSHILFEGTCNSASSTSLGIQFGINVISTAILASSNFFMQVIAAPTRRDIDNAHAQRKSMEIGVLSLRNLSTLPKTKIALFLTLGLSSLPIHLFFNSVILESISSTDALIVLAAETFLTGEQDFSLPGIVVSETTNFTSQKEQLHSTLDDLGKSWQRDKSSWQHIGVDECLLRYMSSNETLVDYRHVIMVVRDPRQTSPSGWTNENGRTTVATSNASANSIWTVAYLLRGDPAFTNDTLLQSDGTRASSNESNALADVLHLNGNTLTSIQVFFNGTYGPLEADYCVSQKYVGDCKLELQLNILIIVCIVCILKTGVELIFMVASRHRRPLITPGDAICSFIMISDKTTAGLCTYERRDFKSLRKKYWRDPYTKSTSPRTLNHNKTVLGSSVPTEVWSLHLIPCGIILGVISFYFFANPHPSFNASNFGQSISNPAFLNHINRRAFANRQLSLLSTAFIVNLPQLVLSNFYVTLNSIFTYFIVELEWASFGEVYKTLRVTNKKGEQRSTHRLQLPYRYSIPLLLSSTVLHWLYSKSIYVAIYEGHSGYYPYESIQNYGFNGAQVSPSALLISIILTFVAVPLPLLFAIRPRSSPMVVGGTCSAVISAACHSVAPGCTYNPPRTVKGVSPITKDLHIQDLEAQTDLEDDGHMGHESRRNSTGSNHAEQRQFELAATTEDISTSQIAIEGETGTAGENADSTSVVIKESKGKTASYESMTQGPLKWGSVWETKLGDNTDPNGKATPYYWIGSVLVPGVEQRWLGHLAFGADVIDVNVQKPGRRVEYQ